MSAIDKLQQTSAIKENIRETLIDLGMDVSESTPFREYARLIGQGNNLRLADAKVGEITLNASAGATQILFDNPMTSEPDAILVAVRDYRNVGSDRVAELIFCTSSRMPRLFNYANGTYGTGGSYNTSLYEDVPIDSLTSTSANKVWIYQANKNGFVLAPVCSGTATVSGGSHKNTNYPGGTYQYLVLSFNL